MTWDFVEANILTGPVSFNTAVGWVVGTLEKMSPEIRGHAEQLDAVSATPAVDRALVITDPPYYDNIPYADLSDFFYVWLRRSLRDVDPTLFSTVLTPKRSELVATKYRFDGDRAKADAFYETGMARVFEQLREVHDERFPMTLFYAFRQTEQDSGDGSIVSTGWEKMLTGLIGAELMVTATWPMRTELTSALKKNMSALASSVVIACRPRPVGAPIATRRELGNALRIELPVALRQFQHVNIAPVDLAQAAIGPGMAVFTRYAKVLEAEGRPMTVRSALALINQTLDEILAEQEGDFDADTRFALTWFEQRGFDEGPFGEADVLARAKDTSTRGLEEAGVLSSRAGKVRLLRREELNEDWNPVTDRRPTVWEAAQHLVRRLETGGEGSAADLVRVMGGVGETARELAYRLYTTAERKGWAQEALAYNALVISWPEIQRLATEAPTQSTLEV